MILFAFARRCIPLSRLEPFLNGTVFAGLSLSLWPRTSRAIALNSNICSDSRKIHHFFMVKRLLRYFRCIIFACKSCDSR